MNELTPSSWKIDPGHSAIQFKVSHLGIASIWGSFTAFEGRLQTDQDDFADAQVTIEIEADSLGTNNERRDTHLKSDAFFDAAHFPSLTFMGILEKTADQYALTGLLTIHDISKQVTLRTAFTGAGKGRWGDSRAGFELTGSINRTDFGLSWNLLTELGSLVVGEDIQLQMAIELIKEDVAATPH